MQLLLWSRKFLAIPDRISVWKSTVKSSTV